jgi:rhodanese-related sulfurtransferase
VTPKHATGAVVIDVRNSPEWDGGHIPGARLVPLPELVDRMGEIPRDAEVVIHCQGGGRASVVVSVLKANGYTKVSALTGGFAGWVSGGAQVER